MELYKEKFTGTTNYNIFVPENVTSDTEVIFYAMNTGFTNKMKEDIIAQNNDAIIIVPENSPVIVGNESSNHQYQTSAIEAFNYVKDKYNLETTNFTQAGYSAGYGCSIRTLADYIKQNPDAERQVLISVDGCESTNGFPIYQSEYEALKNNNTIIISYSQQYRQNHEINYLKKTNLPILFVIDPDIPKESQKNWGHYHNVIPNNFTKRGLYDELLNFALGKGELPEEYTYKIYNPKTQQIEVIDRKNAAVFFGINTYETKINKLKELNTINVTNLSVTSNSTILLNHVNNVIGNVKNTSFIQNSPIYMFTSTTKIPTSIPDSIQKFYNTTATLLLKIANEVQEFAKIGESFDKKDKELENEAIELNGTTNEGLVANNLDNNSVIANTLTTNKVLETLSETTKNKDTKKEDKKETTSTENKIDNEPRQEKKEEPTKVKPSINHNNSNNTQSNQKDNHKQNSLTTQTTEKTNTIDDFPDYKEVYSDENRIVYDYKDEYRIIIHKDGDEITGIEHYYKFDNEILADKGLEMLSETYKENKNIDNIIQKGNYVKVIFKEDVYKNMTLNDIKNIYKELNEIVKL